MPAFRLTSDDSQGAARAARVALRRLSQGISEFESLTIDSDGTITVVAEEPPKLPMSVEGVAFEVVPDEQLLAEAQSKVDAISEQVATRVGVPVDATPLGDTIGVAGEGSKA